MHIERAIGPQSILHKLGIGEERSRAPACSPGIEAHALCAHEQAEAIRTFYRVGFLSEALVLDSCCEGCDERSNRFFLRVRCTEIAVAVGLTQRQIRELRRVFAVAGEQEQRGACEKVFSTVTNGD